jgi:hypothetical protein
MATELPKYTVLGNWFGEGKNGEMDEFKTPEKKGYYTAILHPNGIELCSDINGVMRFSQMEGNDRDDACIWWKIADGEWLMLFFKSSDYDDGIEPQMKKAMGISVKRAEARKRAKVRKRAKARQRAPEARPEARPKTRAQPKEARSEARSKKGEEPINEAGAKARSEAIHASAVSMEARAVAREAKAKTKAGPLVSREICRNEQARIWDPGLIQICMHLFGTLRLQVATQGWSL